MSLIDIILILILLSWFGGITYFPTISLINLLLVIAIVGVIYRLTKRP